ncbi:hypothetical protein PPERSA_06306 [Pseudocohnilembus persalinus]|uniref:Peptidase C1A papain C-terminal domain-containing protein n=1 Tax=Pseudocohnilembus persalinus TaxID=266149 RepID=A0A0V0QIJ1_PSEPJ|nr:hypothetical protein PPERSA_06306 [Pseudocohnilembus persalinus]|eukprot:KRX02111.1 hypothetical protein PPERSA_06306 [Pseudocohnilembus persalinus]
MQKSVYILAVFAILTTGIVLLTDKQTYNDNLRGNLFKEFQNWKQEHGMIFNESQEQYRFSIYQQNKKVIEKINQQKGYDAAGINAFAHLPLSEFVEIYMQTPQQVKELHQNSKKIQQIEEEIEDGELPESVDWVAKGVVPEAVYSGQCSSSYALQSANALSSLYYLQGNSKKLVPLSAQQILSCSDNSVGCRGGGAWGSFLYAMEYGMMTNSSYPYTKFDGACKYDATQVVYTPKNAFAIHSNRPEIMKKYTTQQPITTMIYAGTEEFQFYRGGERPFSAWCDFDVSANYVVLITGYDTYQAKKPQPYWIIQTNMGLKWGNAGYMNVYNEKGSGMCEFNTNPVFPGNTK